MNTLKSALFSLALLFGTLGAVALACGTGMIHRDFGSNGWNFSMGVMPIPESERANVRATHSVSVVAVNPKGESVTDGEMTIEVMSGWRKVASMSTTFMAGKPMPCESTHPEESSDAGHEAMGEEMMCKHGEMMRGHYGFNLNLPESGKYKFTVSLKNKEVSQKSSTVVELF